MGVDQKRLYATTSAAVWAEEFIKEFGSRKDDIDEGLMIAWFANAIERGRDEGYRDASRCSPERPCAVANERHVDAYGECFVSSWERVIALPPTQDKAAVRLADV